MKKLRVALASLVTLAAFAAPLEGQTLGDAARREAERRSKLQGPVMVYTSADVEVRPGSPAALPGELETIAAPAAEAGPAAAAAAPGDPKSQKAAEVVKGREKRDEEHWRERAKVLRDRLARLRADVAGVEERVAQLRLELGSASGAKAEALNSELLEASKDLLGFQRDVRLIEQEWATFEERARVAKIPLSWIR